MSSPSTMDDFVFRQVSVSVKDVDVDLFDERWKS